MNKRQFITGVTPKGTAYYAFLRRPEMFQGQEVGYSIQISFQDDKQTEEFTNYIMAEFEKAKSSIELKPGKRWSKEPTIGMHVLQDGTVTFKFKAKRTYKTKAGEEMTRTIPVVDAKGHPIKAANLGNGSIVKIAFSMSPYWMSNTTNGMAMYLRGVQVLKYVPYDGGTDAKSLGFSTDEDGYDSTVDGSYDEPQQENKEEEEDVPFNDDEEF